MDQRALSPFVLFTILKDYFNADELRTLCFILHAKFKLDIDYDSLPGEGKAGKARELVLWAERHGHMEKLEAAIREARPDLNLDDFLTPERQAKIHQDGFDSLHRQLREWKQVHDALQKLQAAFGSCRGPISQFSKLKDSSNLVELQQNLLSQLDGGWTACQSELGKLYVLATDIKDIGAPYTPGSKDPDWYVLLQDTADKIGRALLNDNILALKDPLGEFGKNVDMMLFKADKKLCDVLDDMNWLRPGLYQWRP